MKQFLNITKILTLIAAVFALQQTHVFGLATQTSVQPGATLDQQGANAAQETSNAIANTLEEMADAVQQAPETAIAAPVLKAGATVLSQTIQSFPNEAKASDFEVLFTDLQGKIAEVSSATGQSFLAAPIQFFMESDKNQIATHDSALTGTNEITITPKISKIAAIATDQQIVAPLAKLEFIEGVVEKTPALIAKHQANSNTQTEAVALANENMIDTNTEALLIAAKYDINIITDIKDYVDNYIKGNIPGIDINTNPKHVEGYTAYREALQWIIDHQNIIQNVTFDAKGAELLSSVVAKVDGAKDLKDSLRTALITAVNA